MESADSRESNIIDIIKNIDKVKYLLQDVSTAIPEKRVVFNEIENYIDDVEIMLENLIKEKKKSDCKKITKDDLISCIYLYDKIIQAIKFFLD